MDEKIEVAIKSGGFALSFGGLTDLEMQPVINLKCKTRVMQDGKKSLSKEMRMKDFVIVETPRGFACEKIDTKSGLVVKINWILDPNGRWLDEKISFMNNGDHSLIFDKIKIA
ncbi:MAG: hypothetical protein ACTSXP_07975, partial [Promethearchaeota archaeon]